MPRNPGTGVYSIPVGTDAITNTTIASSPYNAFIHDVETDLNTPRPIVAGGTGATNTRDAMTTLQGDFAYQVVTNYDSYAFVSGSFYSAAGATSAPVAGHAFVGICYTSDPSVVPPAVPASNNLVIEARDQNDTTVPGRIYVREKKAGIWGPWKPDGRTVVGTSEGISGVTGDMFFGISGVAPNSAFVVNNKADVSGLNLIQIVKSGGLTVNGSPGSVLTLNASASGQPNNVNGLVNGSYRWTLQLGDGAAETGSNVGSDFQLVRFDDVGAFLGSALSISRLDGTVKIPTSLQCSGAIWSYPTPTTGVYEFGSSGTKYLNYDGTNFNLAGGNFTVSGNIQTTTGSVYLKTTNHSILSDGTNVLLRTSGFFAVQNTAGSTTYVTITSSAATFNGSVTATGVQGRNGSAGTPSGALHNWYFTGVLQAWLDTTSLGNVTLSSDYRIKKDVHDLPGMWDTVKALRPIKYTQAEFSPPSHIEYQAKTATEGKEVSYTPLFAADDVERWGFIAHELQTTLVPSSASGIKDQPDAIQSLNLAPVVAALTKALQEAMARIEALEAK